MYRVRQEELPFAGSSHEFVGAAQGDVGVSVFLFSGLPGKGPAGGSPFNEGRPLIRMEILGGPSLRFCFMQGWGCLSLAPSAFDQKGR
jgi:hypothetical protein